MPLQWARIKKQPRWEPPEPEYDLDTVKQALQAATAVGRYDIAQQITEEAKSDVCVVCADTLATNMVLYDPQPGGGEQTLVQVCDNCGLEWLGL